MYAGAPILGGLAGGIAGMVPGGLLGAGRGNTAEGIGRGYVRGMATGGGMGLGAALTAGLEGLTGNQLPVGVRAIGPALGGLIGWAGSGALLGKPQGAKGWSSPSNPNREADAMAILERDHPHLAAMLRRRQEKQQPKTAAVRPKRHFPSLLNPATALAKMPLLPTDEGGGSVLSR
jgi:hypothetical protein